MKCTNVNPRFTYYQLSSQQ